MAPITTTTAGLARQTIDDPDLVSLLRRLHSLNIPDAVVEQRGEDVVMAESEADSTTNMSAMIEELVKELEGVPRWRFQEQADLYEWIKPLNAIDAALTFFIHEYPALLLIPHQSLIISDDAHQHDIHHGNNREALPPRILSSITTILNFLSALLRNSTNKAIFHSTHELSSLLAASNETVAHLALECLATLSQPPLLHRQQAPESGSHSTELTSMVDGGQVMRRILGCAVGWGSKGTDLGLLTCVEMEDDAEVKTNYATDKCAGLGSISFQCHVPLPGKSNLSKLVSVEVSWEDMYANISMKHSQDPAEMQLSSPFLQEEPTEKRRKIAPSSDSKHLPTPPSSDMQLKPTSQLFFECIDKLNQQLNTDNTNNREQSSNITVPPEKQFNLLSHIRLARSFHTTNTRISAIEFRLRAIICLLSSQPNQDFIGAFFAAQPELCGELVDLLRPTVSAGNMGGVVGTNNTSHANAILSLSDSPQVPYRIRTLAIEALTALVAHRDSAGNVNNLARQVNVLAELGVGKGQYLGLLPTLIRYSLAALNSFLICDAKKRSHGGKSDDGGPDEEVDIGQELGMIFLQCTNPPSLPQKDREERALEFIDSVLTLTSAVVSVPTGTAALTDCGIIPALISTIAFDSQITQNRANSSESSLFLTNDRSDTESYSECLLKFITAQAIQILEGAIVTHSNALTAFHELKGIDILVQRLNIEVELVKQVKSPNEGACLEDVVMDNSEDKPQRNLQAARRVLLFSAVNCLTVVFHQQEANGANAAIPSGGAQLRKPELMNVLLDIMDNADSYGGVLAGLVATLLSDVMNADPQVVHYVHDSGLAKSFLSLIMGKNDEMKQVIGTNVEEWGEVPMEACAELVMSVPNVILALSLTEAGAKAVSETNPFPALLSVFCSPKFAMPNSRCLLNDMAAIVGTGMDEIMRHNPSLKSCVLKAIVQVMNRIVFIGKNLTMREEHLISESDNKHQNMDLESSRTYLMQYSHNIAQLLEQILHNEDHVPKFVDVGGVDSLLELSRWSITPAGKQFVTHVTCLSSPSIGSVTHTNISSSFGTIVKILATHSDSCKITKKIIEALEFQLIILRKCITQFSDGTVSDTAGVRDGTDDEFSFSNLLQSIPAIPVYDVDESHKSERFLDTLASLYRSIISVDWLTRSLATTIRAATQRMADMGSVLLNRHDREFQKVLSSESFKQVVDQLCLLHRSALWEVCRVRTEPGFDERDIARNLSPNDPPLVYRIRIVCQEGAICRNGIDIDGCDNIGNVEMGEIVEAYDRCINSSGVLRYQTSRGWVSELTRGHGRENIAEIISVRRGTGPPVTFKATKAQRNLKRIECGVPDLCSVSASMLARLHSSHTDLLSSFERIMVSRIRSLNVRDPFQGTGIPPHIISVARLLFKNFQNDFRFADINPKASGTLGAETELNLFHDAAKCMYLGNILNLLHSCLYAEKRTDRRGSLNIPLLLCLLAADGWEDGICSPETAAVTKEVAESNPETYAFLSAIRFVLKHSLRDMAIFAVKEKAWREEQHTKRDTGGKIKASHHQRLSRAVASSFPPVLSLMQRLISRPTILESPISASMTKMKPEDLKALIIHSDMLSSSTLSYSPNKFARGLHIQLARISFEIFSDDHLCSAPAHILHPWISYMSNVVSSLEDAAKRLPSTTVPLSILRDSSISGRIRGGLSGTQSRLSRDSGYAAMLGRSGRIPRELSEPFQASEESVERLVEMGFGRDHAIESLEMVGSNRVDVAMEYALAHPPSSPATLERRRAAREQRRLRQEQLAAAVFSPPLGNTAQDEATINEQGPSVEATTSEHHEGADSTASGEAPSRNASEFMAQKVEEESKPKALTEEELKSKSDDEFEEKDAAKAKRYLESVKEDITTICLDIIEAGRAPEKVNEEMESFGNIDVGIEGGHSDVEHVTVVVASFLVDISSRYPADVTKISSALIRRLKSNLRVKSRSHCQVKIGRETNFSALAHASVIFFRAIPRSRPLILRHGVVSCLLHCIRNVTLTTSLRNGSNDIVWPCWLAPSLLLLELMAQPTTISLEDESELDAETGTAKMGKKGEFAKVMAEHKKQTAAMAKSTKHVFSLLYKEGNVSFPKKKRGKSTESTKQRKTNHAGGSAATAQDNSENKELAQHAPLPPLPTFFPLIHFEDAEASMRLCLQLLGLRSARKLLDQQQLEKACPPPTIAHATLLLLVRVLHFHKIASLCFNMGGADVILSLPGSCHFTGNNGLVTLALRRMLEDENTLQAMMETEIRAQVTKLFKKQHRGSPNTTERLKASMKPFIQAVTPLICRAPLVFVRAIACSVRLESKGDESSSLSSSRDARVILLTNEERARHSKLLGSPVMSNIHGATSSTTTNRKGFSQDDQANRARGRSKSPHPSRKDKPDCKKHLQFDGTPPNHITSLLLNGALRVLLDDTKLQTDRPFLLTHDYLDILSDLVLAIPCCGAAVHRFKLPGELSIHHALSGCPDPPQTAVSFLLHRLVTQPRSTPQSLFASNEKCNTDVNERKQALMKARTSQASARLIVTLIARSGEGRRRVVSDLLFALSCGRINNQQLLPSLSVTRPVTSHNVVDQDFEMQALHTWGELCTGLAAPRSVRVNASQDPNSSLSFEVVKLMLDQGVAHALVFAIDRIILCHPMASTVACSLLRPLEIFTRSTVYRKVLEMAEKDKDKRTRDTLESKELRRMTFGPSNRSESAFADDEMLEDGFAAHNAETHSEGRDLDNDIVVGDDLEDMDVYSQESEDSETSEDEMEIRLGNVDFSDGADDEEVYSESSDSEGVDDHDIDDEEESEASNDSHSEEESEESELSEEEDEAHDNENEDMFIDVTEEEIDQDEAGWDRRNDELFDEGDDNEFEDPDVGNEVADEMGEWTAIDSGAGGRLVRELPGGIGNMLIDALQRSGGQGGPVRGGQSLQAVENMLSNFLREGRVQELEETLGIRVVRSGRDSHGRAAVGLRVPFGNSRSLTADEGRSENSLGTTNPAIPVRQTAAPEAGYGVAGSSNRSLAEVLPMEYMFGGPAAGAGSEHYFRRPGADGNQELDLTPPGFDNDTSELFPGGLAASTHSRQSIVPHPLVAGVDLPPMNALLTSLIQTTRPDATDSGPRSLATSGTFVRAPGGGVMRISRGSNAPLDSNVGRSSTNTLTLGWTDDGLPPEQTTEEFGSLFGQALLGVNQALQDDVAARNEARSNGTLGSSQTDHASCGGNGNPGTSAGVHESLVAVAAEPEVSTADSGENVDVSSLTISQQESATQPNLPTSTEQPNLFDNNDSDADDGEGQPNDTDMIDTEDMPIDEESVIEQDTSPQVDSIQSGEQNTISNENGQPEAADSHDAEEIGNPDEAEEPQGGGGLTCPPDVDVEVFNSLPFEMQQEICREHEEATTGIAAQIGETSGLDPEALAALPEEMRQEIIEQERQQRRREESEPAADPRNAEDMDNANFLASLAPDLRQEILLTADEAFLQSLPPQIMAEAHVLRERVASQQRIRAESLAQSNASDSGGPGGSRAADSHAAMRRRLRNGKLKVEADRPDIVYTPPLLESLGPLLTGHSIKALANLFYLLSPIQRQRIFQKFFLNLFRHPKSRDVFLGLFAALLNGDKAQVLKLVAISDDETALHNETAEFPPTVLFGTPPEPVEESPPSSRGMYRRRSDVLAAATAAASIPARVRGSSRNILPIVARRIIAVLSSLTKSSPRICMSMIHRESGSLSCLDRLLDLLKMNLYTKSAKNLEQLLCLLETVVHPLSLLPKDDSEIDLSSERLTPGVEWMKVPKVVVTKERLHLLVNALRLESCNDTSFAKVNTVSRRLSRVEANRQCILGELASVAQGLGAVAIRDLKTVCVRLSYAANLQDKLSSHDSNSGEVALPVADILSKNELVAGAPSSAVSFGTSTSNSEIKFLRVLQTLHSLCSEFSQEENITNEGSLPEFAFLIQSLELETLWKELQSCLRLVSVLEGVAHQDEIVESAVDGEEHGSESELEREDPLREKGDKKLQNSVAGLITRFLPAIEAFFIVNGTTLGETDTITGNPDGVQNNCQNRVVQFASSNKVLLNALLRSNPHLLEKGLKAMVQIPKCRPYLDFDVKRQWFKTQVRRLRQQASRRHGSLRLNLRRKHVFEDSFRAFIHRNADELRGRLHITFQNEEGVDAGGLSREFFAILAKEMFNPNYALFMSTEDGCTFQPNPNSSINLDDLNYFRFVGRIVGKAVTDGFLLDAHFTRSLYKHMLGIKPTHHDMQAIDPDYYKNLQLILEHNLEDIGVELTFSTEDHSFGRSQIIDLIPNGRNIAVTDETKSKYVDLVCQHRMTTAIEKQIKAYLEGFHEMVDKDLISIFNAKELELLISGMPDIDIHDLKKNTDYNGYRPTDKEIVWFWNIMFSLSRSEKAAFLQFATGSSKVPLAGFSELQGMRGVQKFSINKATGSAGALMSAHTCFNALDLPVYNSEEEMKEKLLYAISEGGGGFLFA